MADHRVLTDVAADWGDSELGAPQTLEQFVPTRYSIDLRSQNGATIFLNLAPGNVSDVPFDMDTGTLGVIRVPHLKCEVDMPRTRFAEPCSEGTVLLRFRGDHEERLAREENMDKRSKRKKNYRAVHSRVHSSQRFHKRFLGFSCVFSITPSKTPSETSFDQIFDQVSGQGF